MTEPTRAMRLLCDLTPGGSEFVDSPERCAAWVRARLRFNTKLAVERNRYRRALQPLLTAARHAIAACPRCQGRGYVVLADSYHGEKWPIDCEACAELRAAVQATEGE